jgi:hypothetical protein
MKDRVRSTYKTTAGKVTVWLCIYSTLFMGCYTSTVIYPNGREMEKICAGDIESVALQDGTEYRFDNSPTIVNDTAVIKPTGDEKGKIHTNEMMYVITKNGKKYAFDKPPTIVNDTIMIQPTGVAKGKIYSDKIEYVITKDGRKYIFENPPAIVHDSIVGEVEMIVTPDIATDPTAWVTAATGTRVSIPLSDVERVSVSEFNIWGTVIACVAVASVPFVLLGLWALSDSW